jgi:hypothetical protein
MALRGQGSTPIPPRYPNLVASGPTLSRSVAMVASAVMSDLAKNLAASLCFVEEDVGVSSRTSTCDLRFVRPLLGPLSDEGRTLWWSRATPENSSPSLGYCNDSKNAQIASVAKSGIPCPPSQSHQTTG